ncbi:hypothetical protein EVAR_72027_1 [Eumeta japonica]|uniref:Uncharacterized protein n=1 Tax=Eumeta variegata TaxID=151549 RepID=A0A4C1TFJ3_EUMVA|nr:hypothetical protein EVAR_72027_1 [Eumeta japonica]
MLGIISIHEFYKLQNGRTISSHHPWMRVAGYSTNTHAYSRKRFSPLIRNSRSRHKFSSRGRKRGGYYTVDRRRGVVNAAPAVNLRLTSFRSGRVLMRV